jgi:hypothetical protein
MRWAGHVPGKEEENSPQDFGEEKDHIEYTDVDGRVVSR